MFATDETVSLAEWINDDTCLVSIIIIKIVGKFGASAAAAIMYLYTAELYPTTMRNTAVGSGSCIGRIGSIMAPLLASKEYETTVIVIGVTSMIAGLLACFLPESVGQRLPETLDEVIKFNKL